MPPSLKSSESRRPRPQPATAKLWIQKKGLGQADPPNPVKVAIGGTKDCIRVRIFLVYHYYRVRGPPQVWGCPVAVSARRCACDMQGVDAALGNTLCLVSLTCCFLLSPTQPVIDWGLCWDPSISGSYQMRLIAYSCMTALKGTRDG